MVTLEIILKLIKSNYGSDAAFEQRAGLNPKTVDSWKRGKSKSFLKMLPELSSIFDVSADYLLGKTGNPKTTDGDITFDDFTYAFYEETKDLTEKDKEALLDMARIFKKRLEEEKK